MNIDSTTVIFFGALVVAVILHEISHGVAALWFGDDTAKRAGRLTLNPIPHIDPFGSLILPAMGALTGIPVIGWAKPVPVNPSRMRRPREQMVFVSFVGPITNLLLAAISGVVASFLYSGIGPDIRSNLANFPDQVSIVNYLNYLPIGFQIAYSFALVNVFLALFNLLPIPPLDGSAVFELVMPDRWRASWYKFRPYGILVLFALVFWTGLIATILEPGIRVLDQLIIS